jgi:SAM-dependent methyltransferase
VLALGVDASPAAVRLARARGAAVIEGSIFGAVPSPGRWASALLLDGNLGIAGAPVALLRRVRELLEPGGRALVETEPPGTPSGGFRGRLDGPDGPSAPFRWAVVGADALPRVAARAGFRVAEQWSCDGRWFADLR